MEELKAMKRQLMSAAQSQMGNLENVDAKELGEVIDMIKDLEEAIYYCFITKAMDESKEEKKDSKKYEEIATSLLARSGNNAEEPQRYYTQPYYPMWRNEEGNSRVRGYESRMVRDPAEGRSGQYRRGYMEIKEQHQGKEKQIQELDKYMQELSRDITDMIAGASPEEKRMLNEKLNTLASKVLDA